MKTPLSDHTEKMQSLPLSQEMKDLPPHLALERASLQFDEHTFYTLMAAFPWLKLHMDCTKDFFVWNYH